MSDSIKILRNTIITVSRMASTAFIFLILSRFFGADEAGVYYVARRYQVIFGVIALWGLDELFIREISQDRDKTNKYLINYIILRILTGIGSILILFGFVFLMGYQADRKLFIIILSLSIIPDGVNSLFYSLFISREAFIYPTIHAITLALIRIIGIMIIINSHSLFIQIAILISVTSVFGIFLNLLLVVLYKTTNHLPLIKHNNCLKTRIITNIEKKFLRQEFNRSKPFAFMRIFFVLGNQGDVLIMSIYLMDKEIGYYGAAFTIASIILLILYGYVDVIYPQMSRVYIDNPEEFWKLAQQSIQIIRSVFLPLVLCVIIFTEPIILLIFGDEFSPAITLLNLLLLAITFQFLDTPYSTIMKTSRNQDRLSKVLGISMIINLTSNFILIPIIGIIGVALSKIISAAFVYIHNALYVTSLHKKKSVLPLIENIILALLIFSGSYLALKYENTWMIALFMIVLYFSLMFISKKLVIQDI